MPLSPRRPTNKHDARRAVVLSLLSNVIANVPVENCAIVKSVKRAACSQSRFTEGELLLLCYIKVPCAIDYLAQNLPVTVALRTRAAWLRCVQLSIDHFGANRRLKDRNLHEMDPTYRHQRSKVANAIETTAGLMYTKRQLLTKYTTDVLFVSLQQWRPNWQLQSLEELGKSLPNRPTLLSGTMYKKIHALRTLQTALSAHLPIKHDKHRHSFLMMSNSLHHTRSWLYPSKHRRDPQRATKWLYRQCKKVLKELENGATDPLLRHRFLRQIRHMSRGDECCFVCEAGKIVHRLTPEHIRAMETVIQTRGLRHDWRTCFLANESVAAGALESSSTAADVLRTHFAITDMSEQAEKTK